MTNAEIIASPEIAAVFAAEPGFTFPPTPASKRERSTQSLLDRVMEVQLLAETVEALDPGDISPELQEELSEDLIRAIAGTREKVDRTAEVLAYFEDAAAAADRERVRLTERRDYMLRQAERLTKYVLAVIEASKFTKLDGHTSTLAARNNPHSVVIDPEVKLPAEYMRTPPPPAAVPDKAKIKAALQAKVAIDGCALVQGKRLVRS